LHCMRLYLSTSFGLSTILNSEFDSFSNLLLFQKILINKNYQPKNTGFETNFQRKNAEFILNETIFFFNNLSQKIVYKLKKTHQ
jgi:hypothetical protein